MKRSVFTLRAVTVCAFVLGSAPASLPAQPAGPQPSPCSSVEHRQFDFWIGEWEVHVPGKPTNRSRITPLFGACGLREEYSASGAGGAGGGGYEGSSFNMYDAPRKVWHQTWVDNQGALLSLEGGMRGASMVLEGRQPGPQGGRADEPHHLDAQPRRHGTPALGGLRRRWQELDDRLRRALPAGEDTGPCRYALKRYARRRLP